VLILSEGTGLGEGDGEAVSVRDEGREEELKAALLMASFFAIETEVSRGEPAEELRDEADFSTVDALSTVDDDFSTVDEDFSTLEEYFSIVDEDRSSVEGRGGVGEREGVDGAEVG
jgi:hypothetical protein